MNLINAGIKSKKELAQRLIDGEVFYRKGDSGTYEIKFDMGPVNPFRFDRGALNTIWEEYDSLLKKCAWYENITEPVICWIWDDNEGSKRLQLVVSFGDDTIYPFTTKNNKFMHARPVTPDELLQQ